MFIQSNKHENEAKVNCIFVGSFPATWGGGVANIHTITGLAFLIAILGVILKKYACMYDN